MSSSSLLVLFLSISIFSVEENIVIERFLYLLLLFGILLFFDVEFDLLFGLRTDIMWCILPLIKGSFLSSFILDEVIIILVLLFPGFKLFCLDEVYVNVLYVLFPFELFDLLLLFFCSLFLLLILLLLLLLFKVFFWVSWFNNLSGLILLLLV